MSHCILCLKPGTGQCPESGKIFCSEKCQFVDFYLISGMKRDRENPKKLADRFSLSQLYQIFLRKSYTNLSEDNEFWYYAILKQQPELVWFSNGYDVKTDYINIARTKMFNREMEEEEEEEVKPPPSEMDPTLKHVLNLVSKSGVAIIDILLDNFTFKDVINWSLVSRDFNQIIAKSQKFWYLFLRKYLRDFNDAPFQPLIKNVNTGKMVGVDYYEMVKDIDFNLPSVLSVKIISDTENFNLDFQYPELYLKDQEKDNVWKSKNFNIFDIISRGGLPGLLHELDDFAILDPEGKSTDDRFIYTGYTNDHDSMSEAEPISFEDVLLSDYRNLKRVYKNMEDGEVYEITMIIERIVADQFTLTITYPRAEVQPFTKDLKEFRAQAYGPLANKSDQAQLEFTFNYFAEERYEEFTEELYSQKTPDYFTLRGNYNAELDEDEWEMVVDDVYHISGSRISLEKIIGIIVEEEDTKGIADLISSGRMTIEIKKKEQ